MIAIYHYPYRECLSLLSNHCNDAAGDKGPQVSSYIPFPFNARSVSMYVFLESQMIGIFPVSYRVFEIGNANTAATKAIISPKQKGGVLNSGQPELYMKSLLHPKPRDGI